jgi:23S rRNA (cytosine1962-C5)-methyltransferase
MNELLKQFSAAVERRNHLFNDKSTNAIRLFNGSGDGYRGLIVDRYAEYLLIQSFNGNITMNIPHIKSVLEEIVKDLPFAVKGVLHKNRDEKASSQKIYDSTIILGEMPPEKFTVRQCGVNVEVDLVHGLNTGLFLDMRDVRMVLSRYYPRITSILNLFSYTGVFSVHARLGGVASVCNVDISKTVLKRAQTNYQLNGLMIDMRDFIQEDSGRYLRRALKKGETYSMIIFDPPTFALGKSGRFSVKKDYPSYLRMIESLGCRFALTVINTHSVSEDEYYSFHPTSWENEFPNA